MLCTLLSATHFERKPFPQISQLLRSEQLRDVGRMPLSSVVDRLFTGLRTVFLVVSGVRVACITRAQRRHTRNSYPRYYGAICRDLRSRSINIHDKQEKNPSEKRGFFSSLGLPGVAISEEIAFIRQDSKCVYCPKARCDCLCDKNS